MLRLALVLPIVRSSRFIATFGLLATLAAESILAQSVPTAAAPALSPTTRLYHVGVHRFLRDASGQGQLERGWLDATGQFTIYATQAMVLPPNLPESALGKRLIFTEAWYTLGELGPTARANFRLTAPETPLVISGLIFYEIEAHPDARKDAGLLVNVSNRGFIEPGKPLTAGFVVSDHPRRVVMRGIGPTLGAFGVAQPLANPVLALFRGTDKLAENDTWGATPNPSALATRFVEVGAFPLPADSLDAALSLELPPGAYTAQVRSADTRSGEALVEVYVVP